MRIFFLIFIIIHLSIFSWSQGIRPRPSMKGGKPTYNQEIVIVKLKENVPMSKLQSSVRSGRTSGNASILKAHPHFRPQNRNLKKSNFGLDRIYRVKVPKDKSVKEVIQELQTKDFVEYVEPYYNMELLYNPNDVEASPVGGMQDYLHLVKAYDAWEVEKGDSTMIIGILDTGATLDHIDLQENIFINKADPINGFDDDADGFIDNYYGWDFADVDNDPTAVHLHGTLVGGIAAARTDNNIGIAGIGFKTKFMPVKIYTSSDTWFVDGYNGILYAAMKGCKVINLSWGGEDSYSNYAKDVINTVVLDMDVVVVAAAGNSDTNADFFPASYENVLSVANTTKTDEKYSTSTFSPYIDISAPGTDIYSTAESNTYKNVTGTSMASPVVAGAAALVRAHHPELNALQVMERLRVTADDIYHVGSNSNYKELLGKGRLNMYQALVDSTSAAVRFKNMSYSNGMGNYAFYDDTITISGNFVNYLQTVSNLKVTLSINSSKVEMIDSVFEASSLSTLESAPGVFKIYLKPDIQRGVRLRFRLGFEGDDYTDYQYFDIATNSDYITLDNGTLAMTVGSNGNLGYNSNAFNDGVGIQYNGKYVLDFAGFMIGESAEKVSDNMYNSYYTLERDKDFNIQKSIKIVEDGFDIIKASSIFSDEAKANTVGVSVTQTFSSRKSGDDTKYLVLEYAITNISETVKDSLRVGFFADWDITDSMSNKANFDPTFKLGYASDADESIYAGVALLSEQEAGFQATVLYNDSWEFVYGTEISEEEKFNLLKDDPEKHTTEINNIANTLSTLLLNVKPAETVNVRFAITAGASLEEIQDNITLARLNTGSFVDLEALNLCAGETVEFNPGLGSDIYFYSDSALTDLICQGSKITLNPVSDFDVFMKRQQGLFHQKFRVSVKVDEVKSRFAIEEDSILLNDNSLNKVVSITDQSEGCIVRWEWSVNNTIVSTIPDPVLTFARSGTYELELKVWNKMDLMDSSTQTILVDYLTGIPQKNNSIKLFPNPVADALNISLSSSTKVNLTIMDQLGRIALSKSIHPRSETYSLDVSSLTPGVYLVRLETDQENIISKIVKQ